MTRDRLLKRVDELLEQGEGVLATRKWSSYGHREFIDSGKIKGFRTAVLSFIERVYGNAHTHYKEFDKAVDGFYPSDVEMGVSIVKSVRDEIAGDWLFSIKGLITAEVFADFIDMASYLLTQGFKDAAAVIAGSVLEEHLRQLCQTNNIDTTITAGGDVKPKKADRLNADLAASDIYSKLDQKAVTMWLDLRNKAAHGQYSEYNIEQVRTMVSGITEFIARLPA
jgi:uncharacterized protein (DUF2164 family)